METMNELIPFAKEMLSQTPRRGMVKVYLVGSLVAVFGLMIGLVETVCQPFCAQEPVDEGFNMLTAREHRTLELEKIDEITGEAAAAKGEKNTKTQQSAVGLRNATNRSHAS